MVGGGCGEDKPTETAAQGSIQYGIPSMETSATVYVFTLGVIEGRFLSKRLAKLAEGGLFGLTRDAGDNVPGEAADDDGLVGREVHRADDQSDDRGKRISVVEAEGGQSVALSAQVDGVLEGYGFEVTRFPQGPGILVAVRRWFVEGVPGMTQDRILRCNYLPGKRSEPGSDALHTQGSSLTRIDSDAAFNFSFTALISLTPALFR